MTLTHELIRSASSHPSGNGFTKDQLAVFGVSWPPKKGWLLGLIGKEVDDATFDRFKALGRQGKTPFTHSAI